MADPVGKLVLDVVVDDCKAASCPYRYGDDSGKLSELVNKKLKHRVADGNEVRVMGRRVKKLEAALRRIIENADRGKKLAAQELLQLKALLQEKPTT